MRARITVKELTEQQPAGELVTLTAEVDGLGTLVLRPGDEHPEPGIISFWEPKDFPLPDGSWSGWPRLWDAAEAFVNRNLGVPSLSVHDRYPKWRAGSYD